MIWFLVLGIYGCHPVQEDQPPACYYRDQRLTMPSLEICRAVRDSAGGKCVSEMVDATSPHESGGGWHEPDQTTIFQAEPSK
jgi:hypothetical protein